MKHKILNLVYESSESRFAKRKWNIVYDQSNTNHDVWNKIIYITEVLKSNFCDHNDAYILLRGNITIIRHNVT